MHAHSHITWAVAAIWTAKAKAAVHGCHYPGDMAVRMRKVLVRLWVGVRVSLLLLIYMIGIAGKNNNTEKCLCLFISVFIV